MTPGARFAIAASYSGFAALFVAIAVTYPWIALAWFVVSALAFPFVLRALRDGA